MAPRLQQEVAVEQRAGIGEQRLDRGVGEGTHRSFVDGGEVDRRVALGERLGHPVQDVGGVVEGGDRLRLGHRQARRGAPPPCRAPPPAGPTGRARSRSGRRRAGRGCRPARRAARGRRFGAAPPRRWRELAQELALCRRQLRAVRVGQLPQALRGQGLLLGRRQLGLPVVGRPRRAPPRGQARPPRPGAPARRVPPR